jgi:hypothetical protein
MATQQSPLGGLLNGILQGYQMRQQMQDAAAQRQADATKAALDDRNASVQDIMNRQMAMQVGRPVNNGMVTERPDASYTVPAVPGVPGAGDSQVSVPGIVRKADPSRTVTLLDRQGNKQQYELKTDQEQQDQANAAAQAKFRSTAIPLTTSEDQQAQGYPAQIYIQPEHLASYAQATGQWKPVTTSPEAQAAGAPASVPQKYVPNLINAGVKAEDRRASGARNDARIAGAEERNANTVTGAADRNAATIAGAGQRNAATIAGAGQRNANSVSGANGRAADRNAGTDNRFTQRQADQVNKQMQALQGKEDELKATRVQLNSDLANPNLPSVQKQVKQGQLKTTAFQIQSYQTRKAALVGAQAPPKAFMDKIPEGTQGPGPDGHVWMKQDGIVYFVK